MNIDLSHIDYTGLVVKVTITLIMVGLPFIFNWGRNLYELNKTALKQRIGEKRFNQLQAIVQAGVLAAEQTGLVSEVKTSVKMLGEQKKALAIAYVQTFAAQAGVNLDTDKLLVAKLLVESEVARLFNTPGQVVELTPDALTEKFKEVSAQLDGGSPVLPGEKI